MISCKPCTVSTAWALNSPAASRAREPSSSTRYRMASGLSATMSRNGARVSASHGLCQARTSNTTPGARMARQAGAMVWAKKYSISSMSWVATPIKSPVRRRTR